MRGFSNFRSKTVGGRRNRGGREEVILSMVMLKVMSAKRSNGIISFDSRRVFSLRLIPRRQTYNFLRTNTPGSLRVIDLFPTFNVFIFIFYFGSCISRRWVPLPISLGTLRTLQIRQIQSDSAFDDKNFFWSHCRSCHRVHTIFFCKPLINSTAKINEKTRAWFRTPRRSFV